MCGMRFFRIDDDFRFADQYYVYDSARHGPDGSIIYDRSVDDLLSGFQWGGDMNYRVGCRWNFFCDTAFGIYDNHMSVFQQFSDADRRRVQSPDLQLVQGRRVVPRRIAGRRFVRHLTAIGARSWPIVPWAITGLALATDVPTDFTDVSDANHINSDNSVVIHGLQTGFECRY